MTFDDEKKLVELGYLPIFSKDLSSVIGWTKDVPAPGEPTYFSQKIADAMTTYFSNDNK